MKKYLIILSVVVFLLLVVCSIFNLYPSRISFLNGLFSIGLSKNHEKPKVEYIKFEANNNASSTIYQVSGDYVVNKTAEYEWINKDFLRSLGDSTQYELKFKATTEIIPSSMCIYIESDVNPSEIWVDGTAINPTRGLVPLGSINQELSLAFECFNKPNDYIVVGIEFVKRPEYINAIATTSWNNDLSKYILPGIK